MDIVDPDHRVFPCVSTYTGDCDHVFVHSFIGGCCCRTSGREGIHGQ